MKVKLSELRKIVKSIIKEQTPQSAPGGPTTPLTPPAPSTPAGSSTPNLAAELAKMKNVPVRWYVDEANTNPYLVMMIKNIIPSANIITIEGLFDNGSGGMETVSSKIFLKCSDNFGMLRDLENGNVKLYNKKYVEKLKSLLCTKSAGGADVMNIGDYSSTTSKTPVNVAESKRKLTNVIRQVVKEQMTGYAGGTYTLGKGADDAFKNAGKFGSSGSKGGASILPDDVFEKILPCLADFGVKGVADLEKNYPKVFEIVNKMFSDVMMGKTPQPVNFVDAGLAFTEVMSKGIDLNNVAALTQVFTCILGKMKVLNVNERKYYK